jgi:hypothetical protein
LKACGKHWTGNTFWSSRWLYSNCIIKSLGMHPSQSPCSHPRSHFPKSFRNGFDIDSHFLRSTRYG